MEVRFREFDPFNCWLWLRFEDQPSQGELNYVNGVFDSWYVIGRLGGFNAENLQVHEEGDDLSWRSYDNEKAQGAMPALMHNLGNFEYEGEWARCWVDFGTSDPLSLDILINSLQQLDRDVVRLEELIIGGFNDNWPVDEHQDIIFN